MANPWVSKRPNTSGADFDTRSGETPIGPTNQLLRAMVAEHLEPAVRPTSQPHQQTVSARSHRRRRIRITVRSRQRSHRFVPAAAGSRLLDGARFVGSSKPGISSGSSKSIERTARSEAAVTDNRSA